MQRREYHEAISQHGAGYGRVVSEFKFVFVSST